MDCGHPGLSFESGANSGGNKVYKMSHIERP